MFDVAPSHRNTHLKRAGFLAVLCTMLAFAFAPRSAHALDVWTQPNPGIRHLHRTTPAPAEFHALVIDLNTPGVKVVCTPPNKRWKATSEFAIDAHVAAAINGGFWGLMGQGAEGLAAGAGVVWASDDEDHGFFAILRDGNAMISRPSDVVEGSRRGVTEAVSGRPMIVDRGRISEELYSFARTYTREPRTVIGVSQDGRKVIMATVDGRRATSHGSTLTEMAELMIELGAYRAINLDGGGSTTMYVANERGVVNRPSRGWEREVINHVGVIAPAPPPPPVTTSTATTSAILHTGPAPVAQVVETPHDVVQRAEAERNAKVGNDADDVEGPGIRNWLRARLQKYFAIDRLHLGKYREIVVPAFFILALIIFFGTTYLIGRTIVRVVRKRRNRATETAKRTSVATDQNSTSTAT